MTHFLRIIADIAVLISIFIFPWWFSLLLLIICIFLLNNFYEALFFALLLDGFYGVPRIAFHGYNVFFLAVTGAALLAILFLKPRLRFY